MLKSPLPIAIALIFILIVFEVGISSIPILAIVSGLGFLVWISYRGIQLTFEDIKEEQSATRMDKSLQEVNSFLISEKEKKSFKFIIEQEYQNFPEVAQAINSGKFDINFLAKRFKNFEQNCHSQTENLIKNSAYFRDVNSVKFLSFDLLAIFLTIRAILLANCIEPIIDKYLNILLRKRKFLITKDDYGDYQFEDWFRELNIFYQSKIEPNLISFQNNFLITSDFFKTDYRKEIYLETAGSGQNLQIILIDLIEKILELKNQDQKIKSLEYSKNMDGLQYEIFIQSYFLDLGFDAQITKTSGDQGVDVVVEIDSRKIAIQCKHYNSSKIGNDSVQQVYSAKEFFDFDVAAVITNNEFTKHAKQLAEKLKVHLLHHDELDHFVDKIRLKNC